MANKVPPPILTAIAIGVIFAISRAAFFEAIRFSGQDWIATGLGVIGFGILLYAGLLFKRRKTTVNPFRPDSTSEIVDTGIYALTRNPMYLGMAIIIAAAAIFSGQILSLAPFLIFIIYMTRSQIIPEEIALAAKFGQPYLDYTSRVRRWI